ncbi:MAG: hypothetical protein JSS81_26275 [Acidobacteria bacterium]|nr:hypothetical protein [Acidobacteriota bacterium]
MNNQLILKHGLKSKLHTAALLAVLLCLPAFLFLLARYWYPNDVSAAYLPAGFGLFIGGGTILVMAKTFIEGLRFAPSYVLDELGITLVSGRTLRWSGFEKAVVFSVGMQKLAERERFVGFDFKSGFQDFEAKDLSYGMPLKMISRAAGFRFVVPLESFTEPAEAIVAFIGRRLPVETLAEPVRLDEKSFGDMLGSNFFK